MFEFEREFNKRARQEIKFERINEFIHSYTFPFHDLLKHFKKHLIEQWETYQLPNDDSNGVFNFISDERIDIIHQLFIPHIMHIANENYILQIPKINKDFGIYVQNQQFNARVFHSHPSTPNTAAMLATFYIDPPSKNEGGGLDFMFTPDYIENVKVEKNKIYFFPNWLLHCPAAQKSNDFRICFNYTIHSIKKPLNKISGDIW